MRVRKAVLPAAGFGTRFLPATKAIPKEVMPLVDRPIIQYAVEEAIASGIEQLVIVISTGRSAIEDHFDSNPSLERWLEDRGDIETLSELAEYDPGIWGCARPSPRPWRSSAPKASQDLQPAAGCTGRRAAVLASRAKAPCSAIHAA